jgi:two-component system, OmpR family, sensor histidine kinase BaeS
MYLNVGRKLWLAFFCTICLCVLTLYSLMHSSLKKGFLDYTSQQAVQRLEILSNALIYIYKKQSSFDSLRDDPAYWLELTSMIFAENQSLFPAAEQVTSEPKLPLESSAKRNDAQLQKHYYREFVSSISIHDTQKNLLLGVLKPGVIRNWIPIMDGSSPIGFISFVKPSVVTRQIDKNFMQHQFEVFSIISLLVLLISTVMATWMARRISRPLTQLAQGAEALAAGNYTLQMPVQSRDEIGQVCNSFNQLAQALAANEKFRALWIADISHEMRTPLSVLKVQIEALQDGIRPCDPENLDLLYNKVLGLSSLIDDLFELSLSDVGALSYHKQKLLLGPLLKTLVSQYQLKAEAANLTLVDLIDLEQELWIWADPKRIEQLCNNLFENAINYTHASGRIELRLGVEGDQVIISLDDSAPGVPVEQQELIFERLHRVEASRSRATGGAGLGLAICKNIVAAHQGTISASSASLGGVKITVCLPLLQV